ncbi:MAG: ester cyclase [Thermomicrobiales bacterium]|nr:ester cyclase [Thermomicrobiales bacterium]
MIARTLFASAIAILVAFGTMGGVLAWQASPATGPSACAPATDEELERIAREWSQDVLAGGDWSALEALVSPDLIHHGATLNDTRHVADFETGLQRILDAFPDLTHRVEFVVTASPYVADRWIASGTHTGPFHDVAPTGRRVTWEGINLLRVECGKVVDSWAAVDQIGRMQQIAGTATATTPVAATATAAAIACAPTTREQAETAVRAWFARIWDAGDADALHAITTDDLVHHWAIGPDSIGNDALLHRSAAWRAAMPDMATTVDVLAVGDGFAAARWTMEGTQTGAYMGAAPTGEATTWTGINLFRFCDGKIAEVWSEMDTANILDRFGLTDVAATPTP